MRDGDAGPTLCQRCRGLDACGQGKAPGPGVARPVPPGPGRAGCGAWSGLCTGGWSRGPGPCSASRSIRGTATRTPGSRGTARGTRGDGSKGEGRAGHHYTLARYKLKYCRAHKVVSCLGLRSGVICWSLLVTDGWGDLTRIKLLLSHESAQETSVKRYYPRVG